MARPSAAVAKVVEGLRSFTAGLEVRVQAGLVKAFEFLLDESLEVCPRDSTNAKLKPERPPYQLWESGHTGIEGEGFQSVVRVAYGGDASKYAVYVHEDLQAAHGEAFNAKYANQIGRGREASRRPQEKAEFLRGPLYDNWDRLADIVLEEAKG